MASPLPDSEERRLLREVIADPANDRPRLDYANWLEQHAQEDRGRFIRLQCESAKLQEEANTLLQKHQHQWLRPIQYLVDDCRFHRGFPEELRVDAGHFFAHYQEITEFTPISRLTLAKPTDEHLHRLADLPLLNKLDSLSLEGQGVGKHRSPFGVQGVRAIAQSPYLKNLKKLSLDSNQIGVDGIHALAESPNFRSLSELAVLDPPAFIRSSIRYHNAESMLLHAKNWPNLTSLTTPLRTLSGPILGVMRRIQTDLER